MSQPYLFIHSKDPNCLKIVETLKQLNKDTLCRVRTVVGVSYSSDMRLVEETLLRVAEEQPWRSKLEEPRVLMSEFGNSSVNFDISVWIDDPWTVRRLRGALNRAIWWALQDAGITIAFPQLDVHFDREVIDTLASGPGPRAIESGQAG